MSIVGTDPVYLREQYGDTERLRTRAETHNRYTVGPDSFAHLFDHFALEPGVDVLDVGCGYGAVHRRLLEAGARVVGLDRSGGMLREAREAASRLEPRPRYILADAQALPLEAASFDCVLALHMLFHVPDRQRALFEMRRVLRPGGRVVLSTNAADAMRRLEQIHVAAARELGYEPVGGVGSHFTLEDVDLVRSVFPSVERHVYPSALVFPAAEPALRFYATSWIDRVRPRPADDSHRQRLLPVVREKMNAIIEQEDVLRIPKSAGYFVADV